MLPRLGSSSSGGSGVSPLALKLQQVWQETQLKKLNMDSRSISTSSSGSSNSSDFISGPESQVDLDGVLNMLMDESGEQGNELLNVESSVLSLEQELRSLITKQPECKDLAQEFEDQGSQEQEVFDSEQGLSLDEIFHEDDIRTLFDQLAAPQTCSFSTNVELEDERAAAEQDFINDGFDLDSPQIEQPQGAWMSESPFGLEWPKQQENQSHQGTYRGSYYQVLEGLGLKNLDLVEKLVECAKAVSVHNVTKSNTLVEEIRSRVSPFGTCTQRLVHYFVEALVARMSATGNGLFTAMCYAKPRSVAMLKSVQFLMETSPFLTVRYFFPNQVILNACRGHSKIHIVDYGTEFGFQWPALMQELAKTAGGAPELRITGVETPLPGVAIAQEVGCMLREYAQSLGVPFKFRAVASKWEHIDAAALQLRDDEVLVVNCMFRQTNLLDESVLAESPRKMWLNRVRSLNPVVFVQGMNNASCNVPFFMTRFLEALTHYAIFFDAMDNCAAPDCIERLKLEQEKLCREIVNVVACEGLERVQRAETYKQWHSRTHRAHFRLLDIDPNVHKETERLMDLYHNDFCLQKDEGWLLLGWKGQILHAFSAWAPAA